jgi:hypothetical protein
MRDSIILAARHKRRIESYHIDQGSSNDCGPHVVAMAVNFWRGAEALDPRAVAQAMNRPRLGLGLVPLVVRRIPNYATMPWGIADMLRLNGIPARWQFRASEDHIHRALLNNRLVMPIYGEPLKRRDGKWQGWSHVAIVCGWDAETQAYLFVDSSQSRAPTSRSREDFLRLWGNLGRLLIETGE